MLCNDVFRIVKSLPALKKTPRAKLQIFALEISLIALGLRTGYLFDTISLPGNQLCVLSEIVDSLRESLPEFKHVVILHEQTTDGIFFVNAPSLLERCRRLAQADGSDTQKSLSASEEGSMIFVSVSSTEPYLLHSIPVPLRQNLMEIPITETTSVADIIPLAAILIEYPIAYVPAADQISFLSGVELRVFSCSIVASQAQDDSEVLPPRHTFMQFSCPVSTLVETGDITEALREKFTHRLERTGLPCTLEVTSRTERLDRVAL